uniref:sphingomyelin phosphodiesterase n=1 Tax=Chrysemys picta bellii TaxID=8478 RepID=A0A8C3HXA1_CHRPI
MDTDPPLQLRVFNLNCWAIRYLSKLRQERIGLIGDTLSQEGFDLALLQEVWSERDYCELKQKLTVCYPYSHYFKSGVIGSGLCVFSRYPILDTFLYQYSLNGYPYMLQHGDWFCGKAVGLLVIKICGIIFHVYVTHTHLEGSGCGAGRWGFEHAPRGRGDPAAARLDRAAGLLCRHREVRGLRGWLHPGPSQLFHQQGGAAALPAGNPHRLRSLQGTCSTVGRRQEATYPGPRLRPGAEHCPADCTAFRFPTLRVRQERRKRPVWVWSIPHSHSVVLAASAPGPRGSSLSRAGTSVTYPSVRGCWAQMLLCVGRAQCCYAVTTTKLLCTALFIPRLQSAFTNEVNSISPILQMGKLRHGAAICPRSLSKPGAELGIDPRSPEALSTRQHCLPYYIVDLAGFEVP